MAPVDHVRQSPLDGLRRRDDFADILPPPNSPGRNLPSPMIDGLSPSSVVAASDETTSKSADADPIPTDPHGTRAAIDGDSGSGKERGDNDGKHSGYHASDIAQAYDPSFTVPPQNTDRISTAQSTITTPLTTVPAATAVPLTTSSHTASPAVPTLVTSFSSTTAASDPLPTNFNSLDMSGEPRNGLNTEYDPTFTSTPSPESVISLTESPFPPQETALGSSATSQDHDGDGSQHNNNKQDPLSPTAEHLLIAVGAIGAFLILVACIYFIMRMRNIDWFAIFRNRGIWYKRCLVRRKNGKNSSSDPPPRYPDEDISTPGSYRLPRGEKLSAQQQHCDRFSSPLIISKVDIPQTVTTPLLADSQHQDIVRQALIENPAPLGTSQPLAASHQITQSTTQISHTISSKHDPNNTYSTDNTAIIHFSQNVSNSYNPADTGVNRLSDLSSLSSGFGDAQIIIPESTPSRPAAPTSQENNRQTRKFSWVTSIFQARGSGDRDTIYTTSSEEPAPRFRTINSWVAQQTRHIERRRQSDREVPTMPEPPFRVQSRADN